MAMAIASQPGRASYARRMGGFSLVPLLARTTQSSLLLWERATTLVVTALPSDVAFQVAHALRAKPIAKRIAASWGRGSGEVLSSLNPLPSLEFATLEWVDRFNHRRLLEPIGNIPPAEAEARYRAQGVVTCCFRAWCKSPSSCSTADVAVGECFIPSGS